MANLKDALDNNIYFKKYLPTKKIYSHDEANVYKSLSNTDFDMNININETYCKMYDKSTIINPDNIILKKDKVIIQREINSLSDLISLINDYPLNQNIEYNIDIHKLHKIKIPLLKLNSMIGLEKLKTSICDQIIYYMQDMHKITSENSNPDYMHTVLYGPPGTGKTEIAKMIGEIFNKMEILPSNKFKKVTRSDLIAGYLGQTAIKTNEVIDSVLGGVLFIDEAYSLGNSEKRDSYSKECLDTLCESLSNHKDNLMVIIAGYENELQECFFSYNQGLKSRFTWNYKIEPYSSEELKNIFIKKINDNGWNLDYNITKIFFENNKLYFKSFGRDIENFFSKIKIAHSRRVFCLPEEKKTFINENDIIKGFELFSDNVNKEKEEKPDFLMYT